MSLSDRTRQGANPDHDPHPHRQKETVTTMPTATETAPETTTVVPDVSLRAQQSAGEAARATAEADRYRTHRDVGALVLRYEHDYAPVTIYRDVLGVSRNLYKRMESRKPAELPSEMPFDRADATAVEKFTRRHAEKFRQADAKAAAARKVRDEAIDSLLNGYDGVTMSNAEVARLTGLTTARIAQMRTGTPRASTRR